MSPPPPMPKPAAPPPPVPAAPPPPPPPVPSLTQRTADSLGLPEAVVAAAFHATPVKSPAMELLEQTMAWKQAKVLLDKSKKIEGELRKWLADRFFHDKKLPTATLPEGTSKCTTDLETHVAECKVVQKMNRDIDEALMIQTLQEAELTPEEGTGLIKTKYEISMTALKKLPEAKRLIIEKMLILKPGSIELEIELLPK